MAVQAKDGSHHHSASRARLHDELAAKKGSAVTPIKKDSSDKGPGGMTHPAPTNTPIEEHVEEHGPAHTIHYHHDEDGDGMHHVSSYHGEASMPPHTGAPGGQDGHAEHPGAHHSVHKTHHAAHHHIGVAMGLGHEQSEETPDEGEEAQGAMAGGDGGSSGIPGLS